MEPQAFASAMHEVVLCRALALSQSVVFHCPDKGTAHTFLNSTLCNMCSHGAMEASQMHSQCGVKRKSHGMNTWYQLCPSHDSKSA